MVVTVLVMALKAVAGDTTKANTFFAELSTVTAAELPDHSAELVKQANAKNLDQTTVLVVKAAVGLNPAAAPAIVGSIAHSSPSMAGTASATAVALVPDQVVAVAKAAAAAAPTKAGAIVEAICRILPQDYQIVANTVAEVVPGSDKEILVGVAAAIPELKNAINQILAGDNGNISSLNAVLTQIALLQSSVATSPGSPVAPPQGPSGGPPLVPISGTPTAQNPGSGGQAGPGHGYSAP